MRRKKFCKLLIGVGLIVSFHILPEALKYSPVLRKIVWCLWGGKFDEVPMMPSYDKHTWQICQGHGTWIVRIKMNIWHEFKVSGYQSNICWLSYFWFWCPNRWRWMPSKFPRLENPRLSWLLWHFCLFNPVLVFRDRMISFPQECQLYFRYMTGSGYGYGICDQSGFANFLI